jgi:hypothetical protein
MFIGVIPAFTVCCSAVHSRSLLLSLPNETVENICNLLNIGPS